MLITQSVVEIFEICKLFWKERAEAHAAKVSERRNFNRLLMQGEKRRRSHMCGRRPLYRTTAHSFTPPIRTERHVTSVHTVHQSGTPLNHLSSNTLPVPLSQKLIELWVHTRYSYETFLSDDIRNIAFPGLYLSNPYSYREATHGKIVNL
jgi:hypothetical protein